MGIKSVVAITPVWNESLEIIQRFIEGIESVRRVLARQEIGFRHLFLNDGATNLSDEFPSLVKHGENQGLALTLMDGYRATLELKSQPDLVIRLDCQEHDPEKIVEIVDNFSHSPVQALVLPVWYWLKSQPRPLMTKVTKDTAGFCQALSPVNSAVILEVYNQKFPMGFQAFRQSALRKVLPRLEQGIKIFSEKYGRPSWGLDLLAILVAADEYPEGIDFLFAGWSEPWEQNRGADKVAAQQKKAEAMVEIAIALGCKKA